MWSRHRISEYNNRSICFLRPQNFWLKVDFFYKISSSINSKTTHGERMWWWVRTAAFWPNSSLNSTWAHFIEGWTRLKKVWTSQTVLKAILTKIFIETWTKNSKKSSGTDQRKKRNRYEKKCLEILQSQTSFKLYGIYLTKMCHYDFTTNWSIKKVWLNSISKFSKSTFFQFNLNKTTKFLKVKSFRKQKNKSHSIKNY